MGDGEWLRGGEVREKRREKWVCESKGGVYICCPVDKKSLTLRELAERWRDRGMKRQERGGRSIYLLSWRYKLVDIKRLLSPTREPSQADNYSACTRTDLRQINVVLRVRNVRYTRYLYTDSVHCTLGIIYSTSQSIDNSSRLISVISCAIQNENDRSSNVPLIICM